MTQSRDILNALPFSILTDLPSPAEWHKRCRQSTSLVPGLDQLLTITEQRHASLTTGETVNLNEDDLSLQRAELFFYLITETKTILSVEAGFGKGLVTGIITAAHLVNDLHGGHVPIQARDERSADDIGEALLEQLALQGFQLMDHETATVLPQIYTQQLNEGLSFVYFNNARHYDEQMMEYFYMNRLLQEGGIIAIDTTQPARADLVDFIRRNRSDYAIREIDKTLTLVQKPTLSALASHHPTFRH